MDDIYRIHVRGQLDDHWSEWLEGLAIQRQADASRKGSAPASWGSSRSR